MLDLRWRLLRIVSFFLYYLGFLKVYQILQNIFQTQGSVMVLAYHRILDQKIGYQDICVLPQTFEKHIQYMKKHHHIISLETWISQIKNSQPFLKNSIVITFDDGYLDNYLEAFPLLKKHELPATIFVTTSWMDSKEYPWWERASQMIQKVHKISTENSSLETIKKLETSLVSFPIEIAKEILFILKTKPKLSNQKLSQIISKMVLNLKIMSPKKRTKILEDLEKFFSVSLEKRLVIGEKEIKEMKKNNISFGSHTVTHPILSQIDNLQKEEELHHSQKKLEAILGEKVKTFAYPNGKKRDFNEETIQILQKLDYEFAFTLENGTNHFTLAPFRIKRYGVRNIPVYVLAVILSGLLENSIFQIFKNLIEKRVRA